MPNPNETQPFSEPKSKKLIDFFNLTPEQSQTLKERIRQKNGWIEIWVHTHYDEKMLKTNSMYSEKSVGEAYFQMREKLIHSLLGRGRMVVLAFIPQPSTHQESVNFDEAYNLAEVNQPPYFVETLPDDPVPVQGFSNTSLIRRTELLTEKQPINFSDEDLALIAEIFNMKGEVSKEKAIHMSGEVWSHMKHFLFDEAVKKVSAEKELSWQIFWEKLKEFGAIGAVVRGRNYFRYPPLLQASVVDADFFKLKQEKGMVNPEMPSGCLGEVCKRLLLNNFQMRLSLISYPNQPTAKFREEAKKL